MTTFTNDFHNAEATVRANENEIVSRAVFNRVCRELCGVDGCTCGVFRGSEYRLEPTDSTESEFIVVRTRL